MARIAFSKKALATINAGIQTQELAGVKARWSWFLLFGISLLFIGVLIWGLFGALAETVSGEGITLVNGGGQYVSAQTSGTLYSLNISSGAKLSSGQIIGQIYDSETIFKLRKVEEEYRLLCEEISYLEAEIKSITNLHNENDFERKKRLEQLKLSQTESTFTNTIFQSMEIGANMKNRVWDKEEKLLELKQRMKQKEQELLFTRNMFIETAWLYSNYDGRVTEIYKSEGSYVQKGEKIALILSENNKGIYLSAYIPPSQGKKIKTGMSAYFSPAAAPSAKYGYIKSVVREVSPVPIDTDTIKAELMNDRLAQLIVGDTVMMHIVLEMIPDGKTESGYKWTSKKGYPHKITNGMMGTVVFNTGYKPPAMFIVPAVREFLNQTKAKRKQAK